MKSIALTLVLLACAATAAADELTVSQSALGSMGLAGMQQLSDDEGRTVRGKGFLNDFVNMIVGEFSIDPVGIDPPGHSSPFGYQPFGDYNGFAAPPAGFGIRPSFDFGGF